MDENLYVKALTAFDHTYEPQIQMYDKLPYRRDLDVCDWKQPRLVSGNIVKFFQYELGKPQIIQNDFVVEIDETSLENDAKDLEMDKLESEDLGALLTDDALAVGEISDSGVNEDVALTADEFMDELPEVV